MAEPAAVTRELLQGYSITEVSAFLEEKYDLSAASIQSLSENRINGKMFLMLSDDELKEMMKPLGDRMALKDIIEKFKPSVSFITVIQVTAASVYSCFNYYYEVSREPAAGSQ